MDDQNENMEQQTQDTAAATPQDLYVTVTLHANEDKEHFTTVVDTNIPPFEGKDADGITINPNYTAMRTLLYGIVQSLSRIHPNYPDLQEETIDKMTNVLMDAEATAIERYIKDHKDQFQQKEEPSQE